METYMVRFTGHIHDWHSAERFVMKNAEGVSFTLNYLTAGDPDGTGRDLGRNYESVVIAQGELIPKELKRAIDNLGNKVNYREYHREPEPRVRAFSNEPVPPYKPKKEWETIEVDHPSEKIIAPYRDAMNMKTTVFPKVTKKVIVNGRLP